ncbi:MAG: retropepsin-like aspartic protease [Verrucomicrobiota bacterium]
MRLFFLSSIFCLVHLTVWAEADLNYREFTGSNGKTITAALLDKTESMVTMKLKSGRTAKFEITKLSEEDQAFVRDWNMEKDLFVRSCRGLTIRELLELRGYESFKFIISGNHIFVDGMLNEAKARFMIDTGAGGTVLDVKSATDAECEVGPMDQVIRGIGGEAPAAITRVARITLGESILNDLTVLSADLFRERKNPVRDHDGIFGAEFLHQLDAVISYQEGRIFFRPDLADAAEGEKDGDAHLEFRIFRTNDRKTFKGNVAEKTATAVTLALQDGQEVQLPINRLVEEDANFVFSWTPERDIFLRKCHTLTTQDLLELRGYQSFIYERKGNHIFVDGTLNGHETTFMIDSGAGTSVLDLETAKNTECEVGEMDQWIYGVGGKAPAAVTKVNKLTMGRAVATNRKLLSADLYEDAPEDYARPFGAIFGADFLRELNGVVNYRENRVFLRQD